MARITVNWRALIRHCKPQNNLFCAAHVNGELIVTSFAFTREFAASYGAGRIADCAGVVNTATTAALCNEYALMQTNDQ